MNVGRNNDEVTCRLDVFNSVDMSWAFQVFSGAYRTLCRNTQVFGGEKSYQQKHLHTSNYEGTQDATQPPIYHKWLPWCGDRCPTLRECFEHH